MLNLQVLGSSSKGNFYIIRAGEEILLLECGITRKEILKAINHDLSNVVGCLVSHEHKDHSKSLTELAQSGIDIFSSAGTYEMLGAKGHRLKVLKSEVQQKIGSFTVLPFDTQHDAAEPLGFLIAHKEFGKLLFVTDTFYIKYKFEAVNYMMLECNYSKDILDKNIEKGSLPSLLRKRLLSSHFSLENVIKFLKATDLSQLREIYLIHLSDGNSDAKLFKSEVEKITGVPVEVC